MGASAFEILVVPVLWTTVGAVLAGAAISMTLSTVSVVAARLARVSRVRGVGPRTLRGPLRRGYRPIARRAGSIG